MDHCRIRIGRKFNSVVISSTSSSPSLWFDSPIIPDRYHCFCFNMIKLRKRRKNIIFLNSYQPHTYNTNTASAKLFFPESRILIQNSSCHYHHPSSSFHLEKEKKTKYKPHHHHRMRMNKNKNKKNFVDTHQPIANKNTHTVSSTTKNPC